MVVGAKRTPVWDVASISALTQLPQMNPHELDWCRIPIIDPESHRPWMRTTSYHSSLHMPELKQVCRCPPGVEHQWLIGRIKDIDVDRKALGNHVPPGVLQLQATALRRHAGSPSKVNSESKSSDFADSNSNDLMKPDDQNEQPTPIDPNIMTPPAAEVETQKMPKQGRHASDFGESTSKRSKAESFDLAADDDEANAAVDIPVDMDDADILHVNQPKPKVLATQICGGMGNLLIQLQKLHIKTGVNADRCTGWELHLNEHKTNLKQQITDDVPLFLACSFPCKYHGGWTNFNSWRDPEGYTKPKEYAKRLSRWCGKRCLEQLDKGLEFFVEHSGTSDIMHDDLWKRVLDHPRVTAFRAPMCAHDLICPEGEPILKMSWFITTSPEVRTALKRDCPGHERHKEISGFCQGYKLSTWTQTWTPTFNKRLAKAMIATARRRNELESVAKSSFVGAFTCPKCTGADKDAKHSAIPGQCRIANLRSFDYRAHRMPAPASSTGATAGSTEAPELEMPDMPPPPAPVAPAEPSSSSKSHKRTLPTETADRSKRPGRKSPKALDQVPEGEEVPGEKPVGGLGYAPGGIIPAGGHRVVDKPDSMEERQILDAVSEADMLDMPKVLKNVFRLRDAKLIRKAILRWHKRSYHMPERNMKLMFDRSGAPERITQELSVAVRSCPQCRLWAVPDRRPVIRASLRWQFNESVQMDLVFIELRGEMKVAMHVICEGTRYALAWEINSKETMELMESFIIHWFKVFGPPVQVVADQEGGWANDAFGSFLSRHRVRRVLLPKGDHAWSIERRNDTLRRVIQRTDSDLQQQGITLSFKHLVSEASFVCNAILENGGYSVYTSVFGKQPRLCLPLANEAELSCAEVDDQGLSLEEPGILSATCRMREAALKAGLAELSQQRLEASERHNATRTDQDRPYTVGEMVDVYREHEHKGISGWRGPARVTDPDLTKGQVAVRWQGKVIPAPLRWIRPHVYLLMQGPDFQRFMMQIIKIAEKLKNESQLYGSIYDDTNKLVLSSCARRHYKVVQAARAAGSAVFGLDQCAGVRIGQGCETVSAIKRGGACVLYAWQRGTEKDKRYRLDASRSINLIKILGDNWRSFVFAQLYELDGFDESALIEEQEKDLQINLPGPEAPFLDAEEGFRPEDMIPSAPPLRAIEPVDEDFHECRSYRRHGRIDSPEPRSQAPIGRHIRSDSPARSRSPPSSPQLPQQDTFHAKNRHAAKRLRKSMPKTEPTYDTLWSELQSDLAELSTAVPSDASDADLSDDEVPFVPEPQPKLNVYLVYDTVRQEAVYEVVREFDELSADEVTKHHAEVTKAKQKELNSWVTHKTFRLQARRSARNLIPSRWLLRWKETPEGRIIKARLVIKGFKDRQASQLTTMAPTASRVSQRLVSSICAVMNWHIWSLDVGTAFLQGNAFDDNLPTDGPKREASFEPPKDCWDLLRDPWTGKPFNLSMRLNYVLELLKGAYGLADAPRLWYCHLVATLVAIGWRRSVHDPCLFYMRDKRGKLTGACTVHVDDIKLTAELGVALQLISMLEKKYGKLTVQKDTFKNCGVEHVRRPDGTVVMSQLNYAKTLKPIAVTARGGDETVVLGSKGQTDFRSVIGGLMWLVMTMPDIAVAVGLLQTAQGKATVKDARIANKTIKVAQSSTTSLVYRHMPTPDRVLAASDADHHRDGTKPRRGTTLMLTSTRLMNNNKLGGLVHLIEFASKTIQRVSRSSWAAELHAMSATTSAGMKMAQMIDEAYDNITNAQDLMTKEETSTLNTKVDNITDCFDLFSSVIAVEMAKLAEPHLGSHLAALREDLQAGRVSSWWWCDTLSMPSDGLTKISIDRQMLQDIAAGTWKISIHAKQQPKRFPELKSETHFGSLAKLPAHFRPGCR